jgi:hypothetical protein
MVNGSDMNMRRMTKRPPRMKLYATRGLDSVFSSPFQHRFGVSRPQTWPTLCVLGELDQGVLIRREAPTLWRARSITLLLALPTEFPLEEFHIVSIVSRAYLPVRSILVGRINPSQLLK